ncbi:MAG TPA: hemolysin family protein [Acidimicrobiales bacterium]|nr:hemolysin family protein [Acidimicrobiales bacterium]
MSTPAALVVGLALLAANGFFVAAEFALLAARRSRIEQLAAAGQRRAQSALAGLRELSLMLAGAQLGITAASLGLGAVAEPAVAHLLEEVLEPLGIPDALLHPIAFAVALSLVVFLHMVVGEMAPKSWAISHPERSALGVAPFFRAYVRLFRPFIRFLNTTANAVVRLCGVTPQDERAMTHSPADLVLLLEESSSQGTLADTHAQLLSRTLRFSGRDALAAMTPRRDIVSVPAHASVDEIERVAAAGGLSRLLVCDGDLDHPVGVVHVRDALVVDDTHRARLRARDLAGPVLATPESHALDDLLTDMRRDHRHFAVVIDELGVVAGIVTLEDVIEQIIGDFEDESDRPRRRIRRVGETSWLVAGTVRPAELADNTGLVLPHGDWDTIAGYVIATLDRIPEIGDSVQAPGLRLEVRAMDNYAITELAIHTETSP